MILHQVEVIEGNEWRTPYSYEVEKVTNGKWCISGFGYRPNAVYVEACFKQAGYTVRTRKVVE